MARSRPSSPRRRRACRAAWCCRSCRQSSRRGRPGPWPCSRCPRPPRSPHSWRSDLQIGGQRQKREERNSRETKLNQQSDAASNRQPTASWTQPGEKTRALLRQWCQGTLSVQWRPNAFCFLVWVVVAKGLLVLHSDKLMRKHSNTSREKFTEF